MSDTRLQEPSYVATAEVIYIRAPEKLVIQIKTISLCHWKCEVGPRLVTAAATT